MKDISRYIAPALNEGLMSRGRDSSGESMVKGAIAGTLADALGYLKEDYITVHHEEGRDEPYYACIDVPRAMPDIVISSTDELRKIPDKEIILCGRFPDLDLAVPRIVLQCSLKGKDAQKASALLSRTYAQSFAMAGRFSFEGVRVNMGIRKGSVGTVVISTIESYNSFGPLEARDCEINLRDPYNNIYELHIHAYGSQEGIEILDSDRVLYRCIVNYHIADTGLWNNIYDAVNFGDSHSMKEAREALQELALPMMPRKFSGIGDIPHLKLEVEGERNMDTYYCMLNGKDVKVRRFGKPVELVIPDVL